MSQQICYTLGDGRQVCIPLYVLIPKFPFPIPDPRRFELDRVLVGAARQDVVSLAKMQRIVPNLSPELQESMQAQIDQSLNQIPLPEGVSIISNR